MGPRRRLPNLVALTLVALTLVAVVVLAAACAPADPSEPPGSPLTASQLRYRLIDRLGPPWYCDPDSYPVPRGDERDLAIERFPEVTADAEAFAAILDRLGGRPGDVFSDDQKLAVYREWKALNAVLLEPAGNGSFRFDLLTRPAAGAVEGRRTAGSISARGDVTIEREAAAGEPNCPICLAAGSTIDTPAGPLPVDRLSLGDAVWTTDHEGRRVVGTVLAVRRVAAPAGHRVVRVELGDGRSMRLSPGHPLADGRRVADLRAGDRLDGSVVRRVTSVPYAGETWDLLPSGATGVYWADGILVGSTLRP